ncbi:MAG: TIGR03905 family TSCPD domain-containing protein [Muribaculaceae bacterium]|jgi:uncharacterized protein (TIGR03905 family)|nr:TIGR03905 family TSCPD domain-containing protein [Muribaculaceae bacterium]
MAKYSYRTSGTCSQAIEIEIEGDVIKSVMFYGGCDGNLKGISSLVAGMKAQEVIDRLKGTRCGMKATSCPDQLAKALTAILSQNQ